MRYGGLVRNTIGLLAVLAMLIGPVIAHFQIGPPLAGFVPFALGGLVAIVTGLVSLVQVVRGRGLTLGGGLGVMAGLVFFAIALQGAGYPRINDFTTDPADPPAFRFANAIPQNAGRDMGYPKEWAAIQHDCCADLHPVILKAAPPAAFERALGVARTMPSWTVTQTDPAGLVFEATSTSGLFRFQDDVAVRVRPDADGTSRVDVRSKSRDGKGDLGINAQRIRSYVVALEAAH